MPLRDLSSADTLRTRRRGIETGLVKRPAEHGHPNVTVEKRKKESRTENLNADAKQGRERA
jgi:hypothetical protein